MTSTLRRQLREVGQEHRFGEVLEELPRVRAELGYPIMVTPLSQFLGVQAFLNVTTGVRWSQVPDEVIRYVLGQYGAPPGEVAAEVKAAVLGSARAEELAAETAHVDLDEARARFGAVSDELLLLRMMLPAEQVDAMLAEQARGRHGSRGERRGPRGEHPVRTLVAGVTRRRDLREVEIAAAGVRLRARSR